MPLNLGEELDHYRVDNVVRSGNTATVYRGTDLRTQQAVAIKVPHPEMESDPTFLDRFHREQEIGKTLHHGGVLRVLPDEGRTRNYTVTEWFDGKSLREILNEQKRLPPERAIRITLNLCEVLEYIHSHGIVHRNLKPENILVGTDDRIKLINFDVALKTGAERLTFTNIAQIVGASPYISPEELKGNRGDARSDIYALGVILYEMLAGAMPFPGAEPFERLRQNIVPPREINPAVTPSLQEVVYRALEREHKDRYASAHEFALDLSHLDRVGVTDRPEMRNWKAPKSGNRTKIFLYIVIALLPLALFGLLIYWARR